MVTPCADGVGFVDREQDDLHSIFLELLKMKNSFVSSFCSILRVFRERRRQTLQDHRESSRVYSDSYI